MTSPYPDARIPCKRRIYELNDTDGNAELIAGGGAHERSDSGAELPPNSAAVQAQEDTDSPPEIPSKKARCMHGRHVKEHGHQEKDPFELMEASWKAERVAAGLNDHGTHR